MRLTQREILAQRELDKAEAWFRNNGDLARKIAESLEGKSNKEDLNKAASRTTLSVLTKQHLVVYR